MCPGVDYLLWAAIETIVLKTSRRRRRTISLVRPPRNIRLHFGLQNVICVEPSDNFIAYDG